jgi:hypothetical protein
VFLSFSFEPLRKWAKSSRTRWRSRAPNGEPACRERVGAAAVRISLSLLQHPAVRLLAVTVSVGIGLRALFFLLAPWLWHFALPIADADVVPWARWAMVDRDGAEAYGLVAIAIVQIIATGLGVLLLARLPARWAVVVVALLSAAAVRFASWLPPWPPLSAVSPNHLRALLVVVGSWLLAWLVVRSVDRGGRVSLFLAAVLIPICFVSTALPTLGDIACILSPALRIEHGVALSQVYLQYDLLPSLLAAAWDAAGATPLGFRFVCAAAYYAMLLGLFAIALRMFRHRWLAAPLVVSIVLVRLYAPWVDANSTPQVTPLRLDLWPLPLAAALAWGLRRWPAGLVVGLLCLFSRSVGTLYLGGYLLALGADFLARRCAAEGERPASLVEDLRRSLRETAPSMAMVALALVASRMVFGSFGSDAVALYRRLGVGMLRVDPMSFYWWLLPLTGAAGWLAFSCRATRPPRVAEAAILAVALMVANSIYFFGRSHEHNLINTSACFLFCLFLSLDLAWPSSLAEPRLIRWAFGAAPWALLGVCAYGYSERVVGRLDAQRALVLAHSPPGGATPPKIDCDEIKRAASDDRVFFLSSNDVWYYRQCGYTPRGYIQPVALNVLTKDLTGEIDEVLDSGAKVFVPRDGGDPCGQAWKEVLPRLSSLERGETANFFVFRRSVHASESRR